MPGNAPPVEQTALHRVALDRRTAFDHGRSAGTGSAGNGIVEGAGRQDPCRPQADSIRPCHSFVAPGWGPHAGGAADRVRWAGGDLTIAWPLGVKAIIAMVMEPAASSRVAGGGHRVQAGLPRVQPGRPLLHLTSRAGDVAFLHGEAHRDRRTTDDEVMVRLREAARDEREGRLVRCDTEEELRAAFARLRSGQE